MIIKFVLNENVFNLIKVYQNIQTSLTQVNIVFEYIIVKLKSSSDFLGSLCREKISRHDSILKVELEISMYDNFVIL